VAEQIAIIRHMTEKGQDTTQAERPLRNFEETLEIWRAPDSSSWIQSRGDEPLGKTSLAWFADDCLTRVGAAVRDQPGRSSS
jgi:hypothetical protein